MAHTGGVLRLPGGEMLKNETSRAFLRTGAASHPLQQGAEDY